MTKKRIRIRERIKVRKEYKNMKYMIASDIHGSAYYCNKLLQIFEDQNVDQLVLLGDILYHGPRNELPRDYAPQEVCTRLNEWKDRIYAVRGNCDAEVDQMVLEFPIMADYTILELNGVRFFATHGHLFDETHLPPMRKGDVLLHGHTHIYRAETMGEYYLVNPGSISIPKGGNPHTYGILEGNEISIYDFDGILQKKLIIELNAPREQ